MAVDSSTVRIVIQVDENSGESVGRVESNLKKLGAAGAGVRSQLSGTAQSFTQLGVSGATAGRVAAEAGANVKKMGGDFQTSLDSVRLLRQELGIHVPRSMETMISRNQVLMAGITKLSGLMAGVGFATIGVALVSEGVRVVEELWHNVLNVNQAMEDYNDELEKAKMQDFGNTRSIETTTLRINEATAAVRAYHEMAAGLKAQGDSPIHALDPGAIGYYWEAHDAEVKAMQWQRQVDELTRERRPGQAHQSNLDEIAMAHAGDARLRGEQKITAELQKQRDIIAENARYEAEQEGTFGNPVARGGSLWTSGMLSKPSMETLKADSDADNERFNLQRERAQELRRIHEEALESGLRGSALYHAQEDFAIDDLKKKGIGGAQAVNDVQAKFHNEEMKRLQDENFEAQKRREQMRLEGMSGVAKVQQEGRDKIADIYNDPNSKMNPGQRLGAIDDINKETARQIGELNKSFADRVEQIVGQNASRELTGFAKIRADAENQIRDLQKQFPKGGDQAELARGVGAINAEARGQAQELARRNADETEQIEAEAREKSLSGERQKTAAIQAEYDARIAKDEEWRKQQLGAARLSDAEIASINDNANRREVAAAQERDGEMVAASREAREKMAGEFSGLFKSLDHPMQALASLGDKVAGEAAASLVQRLQQRKGGAGAGSPAAPGGDFFTQILGGNIFGGRKSTNITEIAPAAAHLHDAAATASGRMQIASAQIEIGSASFLGGGATSAGGGVPGIAGASTGLLAPGGSLYRPEYTGAAGASSAPSGYSARSTYTANAASGAGSSSWSGSGSTYAGSGTGSVYAGGAGNPAGVGGATNFGGVSAASPAHKSVIAGVTGFAQQGMGLFKGAKGIFGGGSSAGDQDQYAETQDPALGGTLNADGTFSSSGSTNPNGGMLGGGGVGANAAGAMGGALGLYSAYQGGGGVGGALSGAMSGMEFGMAVGGPMGAAIGAVGGAVLGAIGFGGREKARVYDLKTVRPRLKNDQDSYNQGSMDYLTAFSDMQSLQNEAFAAISPMGPAARAYRNDTIDPEIKEAEGRLSAEQRAGRSNYTAQAAQYDIGADSIPRDGFAMIHQNERIVPSDQNERITRALEGGSTMPVQQSNSGWTGDVHIHAIDARGVADFFDKHKHLMRGSLNDSYAENSGGGLA